MLIVYLDQVSQSVQGLLLVRGGLVLSVCFELPVALLLPSQAAPPSKHCVGVFVCECVCVKALFSA